MDNLIKRLRSKIIVDGLEMPGNDTLHREAADRIEALEEALNLLDADWMERVAEKNNE